ncbi:MAG: family 20 glycosylhydrolase [Actinomycetaceae bacterium]|nr:family 20 glycosylhydrolase [Actinomycetaceae bacterium]
MTAIDHDSPDHRISVREGEFEMIPRSVDLPFTATEQWAYEVEKNGDSYIVRAPHPYGRRAGEIQVERELVAGATVTTGHHEPRVGWRGLHVDAGRRFMPVSVLRQIIDMMERGRLNVLNLHLSENEGYRLESRVHPEISSAEHLSFEDVRSLITYANERGITVIPSFDMPGHLEAILESNRWAQLHDENGPVRGALDITNPKAVEFITDILDEIIDLFDTPYVTIGGDEYLDFRHGVPVLKAEAERVLGPGHAEHDLWIDFLNRMNRRLRERGIQTFIWNDGVRGERRVDPDDDLIIHYWTRWGEHMETAGNLARLGYPMVNWDSEPLYFVLRDEPNTYPTGESVLRDFDPDVYPGKHERVRLDGQLGAVFSIWCDVPDAIDDDELLTRLGPPLLAFSHTLWPVGNPANFAELARQVPLIQIHE